MRTIELQDFFNSFSPRLAPKTIRNMHGCLRTVLSQGKTWGIIRVNPARGVRLPRKKARKPPVLLAKQDIRRVIDSLTEPTKSIVTLMVVGSLRIGEVIALRWARIHPDRIEIVERFYEGEFDDTKTDAGQRSIPLDSHGILRSVLDAALQRSKYRKPDDLVFTNAKGGPGEPAQFAASSPEARGRETRSACDRGFSELSHDAFEPDEQCWRPARSHAGQHGSLYGGCDAERLQPHVVGRTSGSCEFSCRQRLAGVYAGPAINRVNVNPFV